MNGYRDFPEWFRPMLEQLFKNKDQATYKLIRVREYRVLLIRSTN